jgi:hypothetical protein
MNVEYFIFELLGNWPNPNLQSIKLYSIVGQMEMKAQF